VARQWGSKAHALLEALRGRSLTDETYVVLMLDGVVLSDAQTAIVALGVTEGCPLPTVLATINWLRRRTPTS